VASISGGKKLEARLNEIAQRLKKGAVLKVGFPENAKYPSGESVALIASILDFGAPSVGIPPRPFFRNMVADKKDGWPAAAEKLLKANNYDVERTLALMGEGIAGQLRQAIVDFEGVPLKPATIARKGHAKQLIDTGHMLASIDYEVESTS
jgi:hypothetical protein